MQARTRPDLERPIRYDRFEGVAGRLHISQGGSKEGLKRQRSKMDNLIIYDAVDIFLLAIYEDEENPDADRLRNPQL